jgi:hypothetical protein
MESSNPKIISGDLNSPFESGVRLQVSFDTETAGRISNLNAWGDSSKNFTCRETKEIP